MSTPPGTTSPDVAIGIPTRNRPDKLERCLAAVAVARPHTGVLAYVCDSSDDEHALLNANVVRRWPWARYIRHSGKNAAAARNECARQARATLIVMIDDDVYVEPDALAALLDAHRAQAGGVIAGTVGWRNRWGLIDWSVPQRLALSGHGSAAGHFDEQAYVLSALFIYPRDLALRMPWPEHLQHCEDIYMGLWWQAAQVPVGFTASSRGLHDDEHSRRRESRSIAYVTLFRDVVTHPSVSRASFAAVIAPLSEARGQLKRGTPATRFLREWLGGVALFIRHARAEQRRLSAARLGRACPPVAPPDQY